VLEPASAPLRFEAVSKEFDGRSAVSGLDLELGAGELFGLIGPNGAGKTTTVKMAVGLLRPTSGRITVCGHDVQAEGRSARRHLGYVPDSASLYEKLTGAEFLQLASDLNGVSRRRRERRIPALLEALDLSRAAPQLVQSYSRGMRQKLALCAALIHDPEVVLLDEPTVGLDPRAARQLRSILKALCATGHTVFLSTHALDVASALCDRVGIFSAGRLVALGTVEELAGQGGGGEGLEAAFMQATGAEDGDSDRLIDALTA
jgi:ABC-2 type transport system ATP-binding protein